MSSAQLAEQLESTVAGAVRETGLELEDLEVVPAGRRRLVRVVVDTPDGAPLDLDAVADVSRAVSAALDDRDDLLGRAAYTLEVSSPGLDRPLTRPRHWRRAHLRLVTARTTGGAELRGRVGAADGEGVIMLVGGELRRVEYASIERAVVEVEFAEPPAAELAALTADAPAPEAAGEAAGEAANDTAGGTAAAAAGEHTSTTSGQTSREESP